MAIVPPFPCPDNTAPVPTCSHVQYLTAPSAPAGPPTVADLLQRYAAEALGHTPPASLRAFATQYGTLPLTALTPALVQGWREALHQAGLSPGTVRTYLSLLGRMLTFAVEDLAWVPASALAPVRQPPEPLARGRLVSEDARTCRRAAQGPTVAELLEAYTRDFLPRKSPTPPYQEQLLLRWMTEQLGTIPVANLSPLVLRCWVDSCPGPWTPQTIRRYLTPLSAALTAAVTFYSWLDTHPLRKVILAPAPPPRERCLEADELAGLCAACQRSRSQHLYSVVVCALSTGARKNELLQRTWDDVDLARGTRRVPRTKNGTRRAVPLGGQALDLLRQQAQRRGASPWVFPRQDGQKPPRIDKAWETACMRAGVVDFHFHDLRHTAASYLAMSGASLREIAEILGHKTLNQTMRYAHLTEPYTRGVLQRMVAQYLGQAPEEEEPRP